MAALPTIAYVIDPRFPGGTSGAVAAELQVVSQLGRVRVYALETRMFRGRGVAAPLQRALDDLSLSLDWDSPVIAADLVIFHNPVTVKFQPQLGRKIVAGDLVVVMHANVVRPDGAEAFAAADCLRRIAQATTALRRWIAPISPISRAAFAEWSAVHGALPGWRVLPWDWHNICEGAMEAPIARPSDRRGRHSRPGLEKFPSLATLDVCFPHHAHANVILGGDLLVDAARRRPHWALHGFGTLAVPAYFERIDFMVYYTSPYFAESFGRSLAEGIQAGKVVLSDAATASVFGGGVIGVSPGEVDAVIAAHIVDPGRYAAQVRSGQAGLERYSAAAFGERLAQFIGDARNGAGR